MKAPGYRLLPLKVLLVLVLLAAGIFLVLWPGYQHDVELQDRARQHRIQQLKIAFDSFIQQRRNDLEVLVHSPALALYLNQSSSSHTDLAAHTFLSVSALHGHYDQIRFIDNTGQEQIRVNRDMGLSYLVEETELQNKQHRYYVQAGLSLAPGEALLSELDLNLEHGQVEWPLKPVLRMVEPVFNLKERQGIVVLNIYGADLLENLQLALPEAHEVVLLNARGGWLAGGGDKDWQFILGGPEAYLSENNPELWQHIEASEEGQVTHAGDCYSYRWYRAEGRQLQAPRWLLAERASGRACDALYTQYRDHGIGLLLFSAMVSLPLVLLWVHWRHRYSHARQRTEMSEQQLRLITDQVGQALIVVDGQGNVSWMNPEAERVLGWSEGELSGRNLHQLVHVTSDGKMLHEGECPTMLTLRTGQRHHTEHSLFRSRQGDILTVRLTVTPYGNALERGAILSFSDNSQNTERERRLRHQASTDELTGVLNRRATLARMQSLMDTTGPVGVMLLDIDLFKQVNDNYGHAAGDQVLIHFCRTIGTLVRREDLFGRIGGEEFLLVLAESDPQSLLQLAERVRQAVQDSPCLMDDIEVPVTVSIGAAVQQGEEEVDTLIARADRALYQAKNQGRNRVEWSPM